MMIFGSTNGITYFNPEDIENPIGNKNKVVFGDIFIGKNKVSYNNKKLIELYLPDFRFLTANQEIKREFRRSPNKRAIAVESSCFLLQARP